MKDSRMKTEVAPRIVQRTALVLLVLLVPLLAVGVKKAPPLSFVEISYY